MKKRIFYLFTIIITFIFLDLLFNFLSAEPRKRPNPFGSVEVNVHKRKDRHIKIAALICALVETNADSRQIQKVLFDQLPKPIDKSDKFLIEDSMFRMCPSVDSRKIIDMNTLSSD